MATPRDTYDIPVDKYFSAIDESFGAGDSPATHDANAVLVRDGNDGYVKNNGSGRLTFQLSKDGTTYGLAINLRAGEAFSLRALSVHSVKVTWIADTSYEVFVK